MMPKASKVHAFLYNGVKQSRKNKNAIVLNYLPGAPNKNVTFHVPNLIQKAGHIPDRYLDLLELASYVYCADRYVSRGSSESPSFTGWHRRFRHIAAVRDHKFWSDTKTHTLLETLLSFMSGDEHRFEFHPNHVTLQAHMFDGPEFLQPPAKETQVVMFSGGMDSTCGALEILQNSQKNLILASHISRTGLKTTQNCITEVLKKLFPGRVHHLMFECHLSGGIRAAEETQRTRSFLYAAVGAAIAKAYNQRSIHFYENGILSVNLPPSEQFQNARATRTTHPKVLNCLSQLISLIEGNDFEVYNPFFWKTKTDIVSLLYKRGGSDIFNSTVSCSRTFDKGIKHLQTHCGRCSQCIDRRFATAAAGLLNEESRGIYAYDFVVENICPKKSDYSREERTMLVDYIRLATQLSTQTVDSFEDAWLDQLTDVVEYVGCTSDTEAKEKLHVLFQRHGEQVKDGILAFQREYADTMIGVKHQPNSLTEILSTQEYLEPPARLLSENIAKKLTNAMPIAFKSRVPSNEREVQDQVQALLGNYSEELRREFPHIPFAMGSTVPDFSHKSPCVFIEVKYLRKGTTPSKASKDISEDCFKYPESAFVLFIVYDPARTVNDDKAFAKDFESKRPCLVQCIR